MKHRNGTIMQPTKNGILHPQSSTCWGESQALSAKPNAADTMIATCWLADRQLA
jgi:hypothetical protein